MPTPLSSTSVCESSTGMVNSRYAFGSLRPNSPVASSVPRRIQESGETGPGPVIVSASHESISPPLTFKLDLEMVTGVESSIQVLQVLSQYCQWPDVGSFPVTAPPQPEPVVFRTLSQ